MLNLHSFHKQRPGNHLPVDFMLFWLLHHQTDLISAHTKETLFHLKLQNTNCAHLKSSRMPGMIIFSIPGDLFWYANIPSIMKTDFLIRAYF